MRNRSSDATDFVGGDIERGELGQGAKTGAE